MIYGVETPAFKSFLSTKNKKENFEKAKGQKIKFDKGGAEDGRGG